MYAYGTKVAARASHQSTWCLEVLVLLPWKFCLFLLLLVRLRFPAVYNISCYDTLPGPGLLMLR